MTITLQLPKPPSVNRLWRRGPKKGMYRDKAYVAWRDEAASMVVFEQWPGPVVGRFAARIVIGLPRRGDIDNRIKAVLDLLQHCGVITNDSLCDRVTAEWGDAPTGCTVHLEAS